jgi:CheY-like chemotaxis protein
LNQIRIMTAQALTIILAEDDDSQAMLMRRSFERAHIQARVVQMRTSREVLDYFAGQERPSQSVLVLLDISLSGRDGIEVLQELKSRPETQGIPVYVLTGNDTSREIELCFALGCNAYLPKPADYGEFMASMQRLCQFLEISRFPGTAQADSPQARRSR